MYRWILYVLLTNLVVVGTSQVQPHPREVTRAPSQPRKANTKLTIWNSRVFHKSTKIDNISIAVNFPYICTFLLYLHNLMIVNVKLDARGNKKNIFQGHLISRVHSECEEDRGTGGEPRFRQTLALSFTSVIKYLVDSGELYFNKIT